MIRFTTVITLSFLLAGCLATTTATKSNHSNAELFSRALESLEQKGSTADLKKLASAKPESEWSVYARSVLQIHDGQQRSIKSLQKKNKNLANKNKSLADQNKTLQSNLEKLNQINLELEKRSN